MQWWNDFVDWTSSDAGGRLISNVLIPFVAIVVAGIVAALIGRGATKRVVTLHDREAKDAAVAGIVSAARKAATWGSLTHDERSYADHLAEDADIRLRMLPIAGAPLVANWAQHEIADIKKNSSTFSFQADQSLAEFRDRILEWQGRPARARKLFKYDLERWKFESPDPDAELIARQQEWNADQAERGGSTPSTTSLRGGAASSSAGPAAGGSTSAPAAATTDGAPSSLRPALPTPVGPESGSDRRPAASDGDPSGPQATRAYGDAAAPTAQRTSSAPTDRFGRDAANGVTLTGNGDAVSSAETDRFDDRPDPDRPDERATTPYGTRNSTVQLSGGRGSEQPERTGGSDVPRVTDRQPLGDADAREGGSDASRVDTSATTNTTSYPTSFDQAPAEPADAHETDESTHTQPISASELRRRAADDDD